MPRRSETVYNAVGQTVQEKIYAENILLSVEENEYDAAGNLTGRTKSTLKLTGANGLDPTGNNFVRQTSYYWHDKAGRVIAQAEYGSGGAIWDHFAKPQRSENAPETSSETCLVTKTVYNANTGRAESTVDAAGKTSKTEVDALGRTVKTFQNYKTGSSQAADEDVEVRYAYDGIDNLVTLTAVNPTTGNQVTRYLYDDAANASLQTSAFYPDSSDTTASGTDQVKTAYFWDGNVKTITDQNGSVRTFGYDVQRRQVSDTVTTLGNNVDGWARKTLRGYDSVGTLAFVSTLDAQNAVLNEIKYVYDANRRLKKLYQSHDGAVGDATTYLEYGYDNEHQGRLAGMTYPSGKQLAYEYDNIGNVATIKEGQNAVVSYLHDGAGSPMQTTYDEPGLSLTYSGGGLDRFGRIINHGWMKGENALVHIQHGYDYAGNRTHRHDSLNALSSETYTYDQVNQIKSLQRTDFMESWDFDKTGNWAQYGKNGTVENRTHNAANEIEGICTHDKNGNMVLMPGLKGKYDAWNRLVEVRDSSDNLLGRYEYNGLNQRIKKTVGTAVTKSFFNEKWQELESVTGGELTSYVWGLRYVDDLVWRQKGDEKLYSLADPNWNVVAVADATGAIQERIKYDAFGKVSWMDANFATRNESAFVWNRTFTGQVFDFETGLYVYRDRCFNTLLGRFTSKDTFEYDAGDVNLFRYVLNSPFIFTDPFGDQTMLPIRRPTILTTTGPVTYPVPPQRPGAPQPPPNPPANPIVWNPIQSIMDDAGRRRGSGGPGDDHRHHCFAVCLAGMYGGVLGGAAATVLGDYAEIRYPSDDWDDDMMANNLGGLCGSIGSFQGVFSASEWCDACCGTKCPK